MTEKNKQPDPRHAEAQIYTRIEAARKQIAAAVNKIMMDTGLPTAIVVELLRGLVAETTLTLERTAHGQTLVELKEALKKAGEGAKEQ